MREVGSKRPGWQSRRCPALAPPSRARHPGGGESSGPRTWSGPLMPGGRCARGRPRFQRLVGAHHRGLADQDRDPREPSADLPSQLLRRCLLAMPRPRLAPAAHGEVWSQTGECRKQTKPFASRSRLLRSPSHTAPSVAGGESRSATVLSKGYCWPLPPWSEGGFLPDLFDR